MIRRIVPVLASILVACNVAWAVASYPTSVKTFTFKPPGVVIQAAHVNDLQDEVTALEHALIGAPGIVHTLKQRLGTLTANKYFLHGTATWSASGVAFGGVFINVTDIASSPASLLEQLQVGGANRRTLRKDGLMTLTTSEAGTGQQDITVYRFGTVRRVAVGQQGSTQFSSGQANAGLIEIASGETTPLRTLYITHYAFGASIRQTGGFGSNSHILEVWLGGAGNANQPNFSVRSSGSNLGAVIQARNAGDTNGLWLDYADATLAKLTLENNANAAAVLAMDHPRSGGSLAFRIAGTEAVRITSAGSVGIGITDPTVGPKYAMALAGFGNPTFGAKFIGRRAASGDVSELSFVNNPLGAAYHVLARFRVSRRDADNMGLIDILLNSSGSENIVLSLEDDSNIAALETVMVLRNKDSGGVARNSVVSVGEADSCGAGFRCLRIRN